MVTLDILVTNVIYPESSPDDACRTWWRAEIQNLFLASATCYPSCSWSALQKIGICSREEEGQANFYQADVVKGLFNLWVWKEWVVSFRGSLIELCKVLMRSMLVCWTHRECLLFWYTLHVVTVFPETSSLTYASHELLDWPLAWTVSCWLLFCMHNSMPRLKKLGRVLIHQQTRWPILSHPQALPPVGTDSSNLPGWGICMVCHLWQWEESEKI